MVGRSTRIWLAKDAPGQREKCERLDRILRMSRQPELIIRSVPTDAFLEAVCSLCPQVKFKLTDNGIREKQLLRQLFDNHVRRAHQSEHELDEFRRSR